VKLLLATVGLALLAGCGYTGPPMPPALHVPEAIKDLQSEIIGDQIVVRFTTPALTGERLPVKTLRAIELLIGPGEASRDQWAADAQRYAVPADELGPREFTVDAADWAGKDVVLAVRTTGQSGRVSDFSNLNSFPVNPPLAKPRLEAPRATANGVALTWSGDAPSYRVMRAVLGDGEPRLEPAGETEAREFVDEDTEFGTRYRYVVIGQNGPLQSSLPSDPAEIQPVDAFAPAVPSGLATVAGVASVDLSWAQNTEGDLAGYNVFRGVDDGPLTLYAENIGVPAFTDTKVEAGKRYRYALTAIDKSGNQSERSAEVSARIE
jgi:hypothetical protein